MMNTTIDSTVCLFCFRSEHVVAAECKDCESDCALFYEQSFATVIRNLCRRFLMDVKEWKKFCDEDFDVNSSGGVAYEDCDSDWVVMTNAYTRHGLVTTMVLRGDVLDKSFCDVQWKTLVGVDPAFVEKDVVVFRVSTLNAGFVKEKF